MEQRTYLCIDMKCFYASVECAERGLNPFETDLAVADPSRGPGAICLAISPKMKARGIHNRCRLFEIPENLEYITAPPRMKLYIEYSADIYAIYLRYFDPRDIHVYSIDEAFIDVTSYLEVYRTDGKRLAEKLMDEIAAELRIPSTAGIGTNLFLAKIALDITAKRVPDHIGYLDEELFRETLWDHRPITDFWQISSGTEKRLDRYGIHTMREVAEAEPELLYRLFGVNAELLIDHANGRESCRMEDIKNYRADTRSVSFSQILPRDYSFSEAGTILQEMILNGCHELMRRGLISRSIWIGIGYSGDRREMTKGTVRLPTAASANSLVAPPVMEMYASIADRNVPIRRLAISFQNACSDTCRGFDLFADWDGVEREERRERVVMGLYEKYGKNAVLRGTNILDEATQKERNEMIGGHRAGYDEAGKSKTVHAL